MKKIYSKPEVMIVKLALTHMVALSKFGETADESEVYSRESNWFDDEE
jgi:hypothetical protein